MDMCIPAWRPVLHSRIHACVPAGALTSLWHTRARGARSPEIVRRAFTSREASGQRIRFRGTRGTPTVVAERRCRAAARPPAAARPKPIP